MRTLYVRIIVTTMFIMIASAFMSFIVTNIYYEIYLKPKNDQKVTKIAENIVTMFEQSEFEDISAYLSSVVNLGYTFYFVDHDGNSQTFGEPFRQYNLEEDQVNLVIAGNRYHGIANFPWKPFVTGFFDNELKNTVGVPIKINGETAALFSRPNTLQQFGEMRIFLAVLLVLSLLLSFLFVLVSTRYIVNPIKTLTEATKKIAAGNYHLKLDVKRHDEIGRLATDFSKMSDSLQQTEEKRQEFVSNVSHEIQSPLTSIQGFSQALREQSLSREEQVHYLSIIEKESRRLSLLSKQLLTLSFLDSEVEQEPKIAYDLKSQLKEVVSATEWKWREKEMTVEMDIPPMKIYGYPKLLQQVWMNLITNAINYTKTGGEITINAISKKDGVEVRLKDNGVGIAKEDISQLFDRFFIVNKARTRTESSTGLGLSIVKKVIELHDGTIIVDSEVGIGSEFKVFIPINR